jgi:hypothetical protein
MTTFAETITLARTIKTAHPAWLEEQGEPIPIEQKWIDEDPAYAAFYQIAKHVGAWSSIFPGEVKGFYVETPSIIWVPLANAPQQAGGEALAIGEARGHKWWVGFDFTASLVEVRDGCAAYVVEMDADSLRDGSLRR